MSANDVMEHFAFSSNSDDQGAFHVLFMKGCFCLFILCETEGVIYRLQVAGRGLRVAGRRLQVADCRSEFGQRVKCPE